LEVEARRILEIGYACACRKVMGCPGGTRRASPARAVLSHDRCRHLTLIDIDHRVLDPACRNLAGATADIASLWG
jgi:hypothetical protein